jgi:CBS domain-containing protein
MTATLFVSRLVGLPVLDPDNETFGHVVDALAASSGPDAPPRVLGFVVSVPGRRIFVNAGRIGSIEPIGLRLNGGAVNLRHFQPRPAELQLAHDLIDRRLPSGEVINDVAIQIDPRRAYSYQVTAIDVGRPAGLLRRTMRDRRRADWHEALPLFPNQDNYAHLRELHPADVAGGVQDLSPQQRNALAESLDNEQLADLLEELPESVQAEIVGGLNLERAADVLEAMAPDDAADLLSELSGQARSDLLAAMEPDEATPLRRLLTFRKDTAGGLMTPEPIILSGDTAVAEALAVLRDPELPAAIASQVYVTEPPTDPPTGRLLGVCTVQRLLRERPSTMLRDCADTQYHAIAPELGELEVAEHLAAYNLIAALVLDAYGRLLGAVTVDDVLDRVLPEDWREQLARHDQGGHA